MDSTKTLYTMQMVSAGKLKVPVEYQRSFQAELAYEIVANFNKYIFNEPKASFREGIYNLFDGQHSVAAMKIISGDENIPILCKVYTGLTMEEEALLFSMQRGAHRELTSGEKLKSRIVGKDKEAIAFKEINESVGIVIPEKRSRYSNHFMCVGTALKEYRRVGSELYAEALSVILEAWAEDSNSMKADIIIGDAEFVKLYHGEYDRKKLVIRLGMVDPQTICNNIKTDLEHPGVKKNIYQIFRIYNGSGRANSLPMKF